MLRGGGSGLLEALLRYCQRYNTILGSFTDLFLHLSSLTLDLSIQIW